MGYRQLGEREDPLPDGTRAVTAEQLRHEALVTVYRILFCLYAEARGGELGILPITDSVYRLGYSIEALRDLADRGEPGTASENGAYYAEHLSRLFRLIHQGFHPEAEIGAAAALPLQGDLFEPVGCGEERTAPDRPTSRLPKVRFASSPHPTRTFVVHPLTATLFAPEATPLLNRVRLGNRVLHQVIRALSLGTGERGRQIGRINYAELGIVQLGAVYEGRLSYKGFFATQDLIQVLQKPKDGKPVYDDDRDPGLPTWFVPAERLADFKPGEIVLERRTGKPRTYKMGEFILHLNGVDRATSASYYTPLVLTQALVRETLAERLRDLGPDQADAILSLKMDAWCGLYFWPLDSAEGLPTRQAWLAAAKVLLGVGVENAATRHLLDLQLGAEIDLEGLFTPVQGRLPDARALSAAVPWYAVARSVAERQPFHHWELVFTEVLGPAPEGDGAVQAEPPRGFDLLFGKPPWIQVNWSDPVLLNEFEPLLGVRDAKSATYNRERSRLLERMDRRLRYRNAFEDGEGVAVFLNDRTLYPALAGLRTTLYKNFIERSWALLGEQGVRLLPVPYTTRFRSANREMAQPANERSLIACILPSGAGHLYTAFLVWFLDNERMPVLAGANLSIVNDFLIKLSGRGHCRHDLLRQLAVEYGTFENPIAWRALRLSCLTIHYADLWHSTFTPAMREDAFTWEAPLPTPGARLAVLVRFARLTARYGGQS